MSIGVFAFLIPLGILGLVLATFVLRFLHRRLRLFTRGTLAFMTFVAVTFTILDLVILAQEVKFRDHDLRRAAVERLVGETAHRILDPEQLVTHDDAARPGLQGILARAREDLTESVEEMAGVCDADDLELACYRVRYTSNGFRRLAGRHLNQRWEVDVVLVDPCRTTRQGDVTVYRNPIHCVLTVYTLLDDAGDPRIATVAADTAVDRGRAHSPWFVWSDADWRSPEMRSIGSSIAVVAR